MVDISFEIGGVIVEFNNAKNALEKALFQGVREYVKQTVGSVVVLSMEKRQKSFARGPVSVIRIWSIRMLSKVYRYYTEEAYQLILPKKR